MRHALAILSLLGGSFWVQVSAQAPSKAEEEAIRKELRTLREEAVEALNKNDIDRLLTYVHPDAVLIAPNVDPGAEVVRGKDGVKGYFDKMLSGPNRRADKVTVELTVDDREILRGGNSAIAWGSSRDTYKMRDGSDFVMATRWSCTLVKQDGKWLIVEFHVSANPFANPIQDYIIRRVILWTSVIAAGAALLVGLLLGWLIPRKAKPSATAPTPGTVQV
jgi:uncharacterized protein (TIGR02246 family)